ncbi:MAG: hypothetical protein WD872_09210 [Pirellulaceae bacterium]
MSLPLSAAEVLDREFLEVRCRVLDLAAALDRLSRAEGSVEDDPRLQRLREAILLVAGQSAARAEQVQLVFSRPYDETWQRGFEMPGS